MDPISLIITALSSAAGLAAITGAAHGISQGLTQGTAQEAYHDLKTLIKRKFKGNQKAEMVLEEHEQDPETYEAPLKKKLAEAGADKDEEIIKAAQELLKQVNPEESAAGKYKVEFQDKAQGAQVGAHNIINIYNYFDYREKVVSAAPVDAADDNLPCPYRGLYHFSPNDAEYFFGRNIFVETLFEATQTRNFIPVLGGSGSGKSSVVFAGLVPRLEQEGNWKFTYFRPGSDPFHSLALALVPLYATDLDETEQIAQTRKLAGYLNNKTVLLSDVFAKIQQNHFEHRLLLIADQFEEIYTQCSDRAVRRRFLDCLLPSFQASNSEASSFTVLITTMRADFLANALAYCPFADMLKNSDIKLGAMSREELNEVIEKPAAKLEVTFEAGLLERILNDVEDEPGNLPLLEFALTELWKKRTGKQLTHDGYEAIGQVKGALADYADVKYKNLTTEEKEQARCIFIQLVSPGEGTKNIRRRTNLPELGEENWNLITRKDGLADSRLVVTSRDDTGQETVEVVHEVLIQNWGKLNKWMETDRTFRVWQQELRITIRQWENSQRDESTLLRGVPLAKAEDWQKQRSVELSENEKAFIETSVSLRNREKTERDRRQKYTFLGLLSFSAIISIFAVIAGWQWQNGVINEIEALTTSTKAWFLSNKELEALIASVKAGRKSKWVILSRDAVRRKAETQLREILWVIQEKNRLEYHEKGVTSISLSSDGTTIFSASSDDGKLKRWRGTEEKLSSLGFVYRQHQ